MEEPQDEETHSASSSPTLVILESDEEEKQRKWRIRQQNFESRGREQSSEEEAPNRERSGSLPVNGNRKQFVPIAPRPAPPSLPASTPPSLRNLASMSANNLASMSVKDYIQKLSWHRRWAQPRHTSEPPPRVEARAVVSPRETSSVPLALQYPVTPRPDIPMTANMVPILYPILQNRKSEEFVTSQPSTSTAHLELNGSSESFSEPPEDPVKDTEESQNPESESIADEESSELTQDFNDIQMENGAGPTDFSTEDPGVPLENGARVDSRASTAIPEGSLDSRASSGMDGRCSRASSKAPEDSRVSKERSMSPQPLVKVEEPMEVDEQEDVEDVKDSEAHPEDVEAPEAHVENMEASLSNAEDVGTSEARIEDVNGVPENDNLQNPENAPESNSEDVGTSEAPIEDVENLQNPENAPEDVPEAMEIPEELQIIKQEPEDFEEELKLVSEDVPSPLIKLEDVPAPEIKIEDVDDLQNPPEDVKDSSVHFIQIVGTLDAPESIPKTEPEAPKRSHKKKPEKMKVVVEPTRKSTRIQGKIDAEKKDDEVLEIEKKTEDNEPKFQNRGVCPPLGLRRAPFHLKQRHTEEKADRLKNQLHINMVPSQLVPGTLKIAGPSTRGTKRPGSPDTDTPPPLDLPISTRRKALQAPDTEMTVRIHPTLYQVKESDMPYYGDYVPSEEYEDREEAVFIPIENLEKEPVTVKKNWKSSVDKYYDGTLTIYWRAIWRQWKGQIDFDTALKHLMERNYNISEALDTIDQKLPEVPQEMKPITMAQATALKKNLQAHKVDKTSLRTIQEKWMRNYHLGEIHNYLYQFHRYYAAQERYGVACNCESLMTFDLNCEPRVSCSRCNRHHRNKSYHTERNKRCFICQSYIYLEKVERPARKTIFNEREVKFIQDWNRREVKLKRELSREEVEAQILAENTAKWKRQILTPEEWDMLDERLLKITNKDIRAKPSASDPKLRGEKIAQQLQPFVLPLFTKCQCRLSGGVTRLSPNVDKKEWTKEEQVVYRDLLIKYDGQHSQVSEDLGVEVELVERFLDTYKKDNELWKGYPFPRIPRRIKVPPDFLPPHIPDGDSANNSRDGSPYFPPGEKRAAKKFKRN